MQRPNTVILLLFGAIVFVMQWSIFLDLSFDLLPNGVLIGLLIISLSLMFYLPSTIYDRKNGTLMHRWFLTIAIASIAAFSFSFYQMNIANELAQQRGSRIIRSLEVYKKDNNVFPEFLDELTSDYISEIPETGFGVFTHHSFDYSSSDDRSEYWLEYQGYLGSDCYYSSEDKDWTCNE